MVFGWRNLQRHIDRKLRRSLLSSSKAIEQSQLSGCDRIAPIMVRDRSCCYGNAIAVPKLLIVLLGHRRDRAALNFVSIGFLN
ncbi:MAG: hypothetical protein HC899_33845 [Leptolyngbyaceae cyanobacterium SM1_4_3]|nr:hypothetical protein [Leptolyngbyaceae cyanobacterium SM1_4_3]